ncbi:MAG: tetraacyldisaccharide 4'-kinase [Deltaproteobacteria bacterium]|nr:tetraacyldisaccharide 4'-kinase [Deltaproteobacteria bacterium]
MGLDLAAVHQDLLAGRAAWPWRATARALAWPYGLGARLDAWSHQAGWQKVQRLPAPVVGVGNLAVGGTGKTPLVLAVLQTLARWGVPAAVISRGYGGRAKGPVTWVSRGQGLLAGAGEAGDEPVLLAQRSGAPVAVGRDRAAVGRALLAELGPRVLVGDDLFQHHALHRDLNLVALDAASPLGNGFLLPRGELREPPTALARADAVIFTRAASPEAAAQARALVAPWWEGPTLACRHVILGFRGPGGEELPLDALAGRRAVGFAGLARPGDFRHTLEELGLSVAGFRAFADHHAYTPAEVSALVGWARENGAELALTSEKDRVRLAWPEEAAVPLYYPVLGLEFWEGPAAWERLLAWGLAAWKG